MRQKNEPIGEVECPVKGCTLKAAVFKFRARTEGRARFAGKVYCMCPVHGRYGTDGTEAFQEYILNEGKIWGDTKKTDDTSAAPIPPIPVAPAPAAAKPAAPTPAAKRAVPAPAEPAAKGPEPQGTSSWKTLLG